MIDVCRFGCYACVDRKKNSSYLHETENEKVLPIHNGWVILIVILITGIMSEFSLCEVHYYYYLMYVCMYICTHRQSSHHITSHHMMPRLLVVKYSTVEQSMPHHLIIKTP